MNCAVNQAVTTGVEMTNSIKELKEEARRLRQNLTMAGTSLSHSQSLELVAKQKGHKDWNTLFASIGNKPEGPPVWIGQLVEGTYLGQRFTAEVLGVQSQLSHGRWRITLDLAEPVDVVKFESFSSMRRRISATINSDGSTSEKTSDGIPQMVLDLSA
jgi:hypothetical protein